MMHKKLYNLVVLILALAFITIPVAAQEPAPLTDLQPVALISDDNTITFSAINETDIMLSGPYDAYSILFGLPADWQLTDGAELELLLAVSFNTDAASSLGADNTSGTLGGIMVVRFNKVVIGTLQLNQQGNVVQSLAIPQDAFTSQRSDGRMELDFVLDSGLTCQVNQQMNVIIGSNSRFGFPHNLVTPDTSLVNFPRPIYQDSMVPDEAVVVIPDNPSAAELQSAMTVAAGLGNLTSSRLAMTLTTVSALTPLQKSTNHLIVVGNGASLPILSELGLPAAIKDGLYQLAGTNVDDGIVQMVNSPWSSNRVVLLVSGNTDAGTIKAAQAVSTGVLRPYDLPNVAVIAEVSADSSQASTLADQTLSDLGYAMDILTQDGVSTATYNFYLQPGQTLGEDAFLDLVYGHSALLNYEQSGVVVLLNDQPVSSIRFSDVSALKANNHLKVMIPASAVLPGNNRVDVRTTLTMRDICMNPSSNAQWFAIWPDSSFHLPLSLSPVAQDLFQGSLDAYPVPYVNDPSLGTTAFVLQQDSPESWASALQIAAYLGDRANGSVTSLTVFYGETTDPAVLADYNLLVIGRPSKMAIVTELNTYLPAPFASGSEMASESAMPVVYRIPENASIGYVQYLASPWNADHMVMVVLGNTDQGVDFATASLIDPLLRSRLAGNFAAVNEQQVITADTRIAPVVNEDLTAATEDGTLVPESGKIDLTPQPVDRPVWMLPAILVVVGLVVIVLAAALIVGMRKKGQNKR